MGGAVALSAFASTKPPMAQGCVLVGPAVWGWSALPFLYRAALWLAAHTLPRWGLTGAGRHIRATDNDFVTRAYGRDPLFQKATRADSVYGLVTLMGEGSRAGAHLGTLPVLLLYGGNDQIIPRAATLVFAKLLGPSAKVIFYPEGFHMLLRDRAGAACAMDVVEWIESIARKERAGSAVSPFEGADAGATRLAAAG
jgi:alpha-beta hydrolase superfamily lysophospholipase